MSETMQTQLTIQSLYEKNQELYSHLKNYMPEFEVEFDEGSQEIQVSMKLNGKTHQAIVERPEIDYYDSKDQSGIIADQLLEPFKNLIIDMILKDVDIINQNLKNWGTN